MTRTTTITWKMTPEEHAFWLAHARDVHLTVAEYLWVLAVGHLAEHDVEGPATNGLIAVRDSMRQIAAAKERRLEQRQS